MGSAPRRRLPAPHRWAGLYRAPHTGAPRPDLVGRPGGRAARRGHQRCSTGRARAEPPARQHGRGPLHRDWGLGARPRLQQPWPGGDLPGAEWHGHVECVRRACALETGDVKVCRRGLDGVWAAVRLARSGQPALRTRRSHCAGSRGRGGHRRRGRGGAQADTCRGRRGPDDADAVDRAPRRRAAVRPAADRFAGCTRPAVVRHHHQRHRPSPAGPDGADRGSTR